MSPWRTTTRRNTAVRVITAIGAIFAGIEILYMIMVLAGANAGNAFFQFIKSLAVPLALFCGKATFIDADNISCSGFIPPL